jgi:hypothetical protein
MLMTSARVDPVTSGPALVANGPSSARSCRPATVVRLATVKLRRAKNAATGVSAVNLRCPRQSQRLTDVLGVHDDFAEVGRGVTRGGGAVDDGSELVERLGRGATPMLDHPALIVHIDSEARADHASRPLPLVQACRGGEMGHDLFDVPLSAQRAVLPLFGVEAREVFRQRRPFSVRQRPEMIVPRSRHIAPMPSHAQGSQ